MVKRSLDQKLRLRNSGARNKKIETGALLRVAGYYVALKEKHACAVSGEEKVSVR